MGHRHLAVSNAVNHVADDGEYRIDGGRADLLQEQGASVAWRRAVIERIQQRRLRRTVPVEIIDIEVAGQAIDGVIDPQIAVTWIGIADPGTEIPLHRERFTLRPGLAYGADITGPAFVGRQVPVVRIGFRRRVGVDGLGDIGRAKARDRAVAGVGRRGVPLPEPGQANRTALQNPCPALFEPELPGARIRFERVLPVQTEPRVWCSALDEEDDGRRLQRDQERAQLGLCERRIVAQPRHLDDAVRRIGEVAAGPSHLERQMSVVIDRRNDADMAVGEQPVALFRNKGPCGAISGGDLSIGIEREDTGGIHSTKRTSHC